MASFVHLLNCHSVIPACWTMASVTTGVRSVGQHFHMKKFNLRTARIGPASICHADRTHNRKTTVVQFCTDIVLDTVPAKLMPTRIKWSDIIHGFFVHANATFKQALDLLVPPDRLQASSMQLRCVGQLFVTGESWVIRST
jgi:hypothetical protein